MPENIGKVVQIIGPVVDISFDENHLPDLLSAIEIKREGQESLIVEVEQGIGADRVRCIAMGSTDGLVRGMEAYDTGKPIQAPVGDAILGRMFNVLGRPIDGLGELNDVDWEDTDVQDKPMVSRRILVTQPSINGKTLGEMHFSSMYGVNVTRVNRSGMDLFAARNLRLQVGDRVMMVGPQDSIERVAGVLGNQLKRLDHPNIVTIFVGILCGIIFGSLPIAVPGMPTPVKLGLAGGPLIISILIGRFGYKMKLVTYTTMSANLMLREVGLVLFLASVGIKAGENFVETVVGGDGLLYVGIGFLITFIPLIVMGMVGRWRCRVNYYTLIGLIAGSNTDPPALAYSNQISGNDAPAVGYSTVYPLSMFLRILTAQLLILLMAG